MTAPRSIRTISLRALVAACAAAATACAGGGGAARHDAAGAAPDRAAAPDAQGAPTPPAEPAPVAAAPKRELSPKAQRLFDQAVAAADEQRRLKVPTDWEALERRWRAVVDEAAVPEAWFNLGVALQHLGRADEARDAYRKALKLEPSLGVAAVNLALLDEPKDPRQAAQAWIELMRRWPDDALPRVRLAALYGAAGQHEEAWRLAREGLVRDPRSVGAYKVLMRVALDQGKLDLAQLLAVKARKLDAADPEIVAFEGDVLLRMKDRPGAVAKWKQALAVRADYLPARYALLSDALGKQLWSIAADQARAILRTRPDDARVQLALGVAYRYLGEPDKALAAYDAAEKLGGDRLAEVHLARGVTLMKSKEQCEPAIAELQKYVAAAGPGVAADGPAGRLIRECATTLADARAAADAAREARAQAERDAKAEADRKAAKPEAAGGAPQAGDPAAAPESAPSPTR